MESVKSFTKGFFDSFLDTIFRVGRIVDCYLPSIFNRMEEVIFHVVYNGNILPVLNIFIEFLIIFMILSVLKLHKIQKGTKFS